MPKPFVFSLIAIQAVAQSTIIGQGLALDTLKSNKKVLIIQKLLPEGWLMRLSDNNLSRTQRKSLVSIKVSPTRDEDILATRHLTLSTKY